MWLDDPWGNVPDGCYGPMDNKTGFGAGVVAPGDLTGDGVEDVAIADTPSPDRGTGAWALFAGPDFAWREWASEAHTGAPSTGGGHSGTLAGPVLPARVLDWPTSARAARCGDVDGDGLDDLCTADGVVFGPIADGAHPGLTWTATDPRVAGADLDADGRGELLVSDAATGALHHLSTLTRSGESSLPDLAATTWTVPGGQVTALAVGDLDADGAPDLVVGFAGSGGTGVSVGLPSGGGDLVAGARTRLAVVAEDLAIGDFDGDGHADLAVGGDAKVTLWLGPLDPGDLADTAADARYVGDEYPLDHFGRALAAADTDGDGRAELAIGAPGDDITNDPDGHFESGRVWWLPGAGL